MELYARQNKPNEWQTGMKDACCKEPLGCCCSVLCSPWGCTACYWRKEAIEEYGTYPDDYQCFQGYQPNCCAKCISPIIENSKGNQCCLCLEGCCCPINALQMTRLYVMDADDLSPDPCDYKIIRCSNCLQYLSCLCHVLACFFEELRECAQVVDCIADCFTFSMAGCMGAQLCAQIKYHKSSLNAKVGGAPVQQILDDEKTSAVECAPQMDKIERE